MSRSEYRILLVGDGISAAIEGALAAGGKPRLVVSRAGWEGLDDRDAELLIFCGDDARAAEWLRNGGAQRPTMAVTSADSPLAELVDDFVLDRDGVADELRHRAMRLLRGEDLDDIARRLGDELALRQLVGNEPSFLEVLRQIERFAPTDVPVLIVGETGTGKELCARALHQLGLRRKFPFIAADCSAVPEHLFENEMFGHCRGAYTDAAADQKGVVGLCDRGTLFLDEIDSLSLAAQGKLLRFLQEHTYRPLGGEKFLRSDVNVLAATNRDLATMVKEKQFRADLFYRLNVLQIRMPPLRERRGDVMLLARHFLDEAAARQGRRLAFAPSALHKLAAYEWPGNVRELANLVQRAALVAEGTSILPQHVALPGQAIAEELVATGFRVAKRRAIEDFERAYVGQLLAKHDGNISRAAREAGQERRAFGRLAKKYNLGRERPRSG